MLTDLFWTAKVRIFNDLMQIFLKKESQTLFSI